MAKQREISEEEHRIIAENVSYDPETGKMSFPEKTHLYAPGCSREYLCSNGYMSIRIKRRSYRSHRIGWLLFYGSLPPHDIDHVNSDRADNRISNLQAVTRGENLRKALPRRDNASGHRGVYWHAKLGKWAVQVTFEKVTHHGGVFHHLPDAVAARNALAQKLHGEFYRAS